MKDRKFYLTPINGRKSFYGKCYVNEYVNEDGDHYSDLISYATRVAYYNHKTNEISVFGWFSKTTANHINSFLAYYGFDTLTKEEMINFKN